MATLFDLSGKRALVTGGTHGLGLAMAHGLGNAGATLIINGHSDQARIDSAIDDLRNAGIGAHGTRLYVVLHALFRTDAPGRTGDLGA